MCDACSYCSIGLKGNACARTVDVLHASVKCSCTCHSRSSASVDWKYAEFMQSSSCTLFTVFLEPTNKNKPAVLTSYMYEHLGGVVMLENYKQNFFAYILTTMSVVTDMEACRVSTHFFLMHLLWRTNSWRTNKDICYKHVPCILTISIPHRPKWQIFIHIR